jgi:hypothetical protein
MLPSRHVYDAYTRGGRGRKNQLLFVRLLDGPEHRGQGKGLFQGRPGSIPSRHPTLSSYRNLSSVEICSLITRSYRVKKMFFKNWNLHRMKTGEPLPVAQSRTALRSSPAKNKKHFFLLRTNTKLNVVVTRPDLLWLRWWLTVMVLLRLAARWRCDCLSVGLVPAYRVIYYSY